MALLGRFSLRTRIVSVLVCSVVAVLTVILIGGTTMRSRLMAHRAAQLEAAVRSAMSVAHSLEIQVEARKLTREQAVTRLAGLARAIRVDAGRGYFMVLTEGAPPNPEANPGRVDIRRSRAPWFELATLLGGRDAALLEHGFPQPGTAVPRTGMAYVARFNPFGILFLAGVEIDGLSHGRLSSMENPALAAIIVIAAVVIALLLNRDRRATLAQSDLDGAAADQGRHDDKGAATGAPLERFRDAVAEPQAVDAVVEPERTQRSSAAEYDQLRDDGSPAPVEIVSNTAERRATPQTITRDADQVGNLTEQHGVRPKEAAAMMGPTADAIRQSRQSILYTRSVPERAADSVRAEREARRVTWDSETGRALAEITVQMGDLDAILSQNAASAKNRALRPGELNSAPSVRHGGAANLGLVAQSGRFVDPTKRLRPDSANPARDSVAGAAPLRPVPLRSIRPHVAASRPALTNGSATKPTLAGLAQTPWPRRDAPPLVCQAVSADNNWQEV